MAPPAEIAILMVADGLAYKFSHLVRFESLAQDRACRTALPSDLGFGGHFHLIDDDRHGALLPCTKGGWIQQDSCTRKAWVVDAVGIR